MEGVPGNIIFARRKTYMDPLFRPIVGVPRRLGQPEHKIGHIKDDLLHNSMRSYIMILISAWR